MTNPTPSEQRARRFDKKFPKFKSKEGNEEWQTVSTKSAHQLLLHKWSGRGWKLISVRQEIKAFCEEEVAEALAEQKEALRPFIQLFPIDEIIKKEVRRAVEEAREHFYCEYCGCPNCQKAEILSTTRE